MSRRLRGYPWPSLAISPYHSSPPAGPLSFSLSLYIYIYIYIYMSQKVKLECAVKRDLNAPCFNTFNIEVSGRVQLHFLDWSTLLLIRAFLILSVKQGSIKYDFLSLWYDSTRDFIPVSRSIGEYVTPSANGPICRWRKVEKNKIM